jgi:hypothetical protein
MSKLKRTFTMVKFKPYLRTDSSCSVKCILRD